MADTVNTNVIFSGNRKHVVQLLNTSDGTGETAAIKVNKSDLALFDGSEPGDLALLEAEWNIQGFTSVTIYWDHTVNDEMLHLSGNGYKDFREHGALYDPKSPGGTGDAVLTTAGAAVGATYDIVLTFKLRN
jgi:hypothetical protein